MLNPKVIDSFLNRKLDSYDWMKREPRKALEEALNELTPVPKLGNLWLHQLVCFLIIETLHRFMLFIDMGGGKTLITLSVLRYRKQRGETPKAIVFVPYVTSVETWITEVKTHAPELLCVPLYGSTAENYEKLITAKGDLYVISYPSAIALFSKVRKNKKTGKNEWYLDRQFLLETFDDFDSIIMDEIHKCKSASSLTFYMCRALSAHCEYAIGLTGTPFGRDLQDLWPQFYLIDFGDTLGDTFTLYREAFFKKKEKYWGGYEYKFKQKLFKKLQELIKNVSIRYRDDEFSDMPPAVTIPIHVRPHEGIAAYAKRSIATINETLAKGGKYRAIESEYLRLRQLSSGFMTLKGEDNNKVQVQFDENPKLEALQSLVEAMPTGCKMVVFHHFVYTNQLISDRLKAMKVPHARIYGKTKDPIAELNRFKNDPECTVLVLNSKSGSSSLNLQVANYGVFFETPDSAIDWQQGRKRIYRPGQLKRVWFYDVIMNGTADASMVKMNKEGKDLLHELLDNQMRL